MRGAGGAAGALRVLHCPTTVGGHPQALARAERELGLASVAVALDQTFLNYQTDEVMFRPGEHQLKRNLKLWGLLWRAARGFDVVHYNFGSTIMPAYFPPDRHVGTKYPRALYEAYDLYRRLGDMRDLGLLSRLGKGVAVTFQGDDARQGDFCRAHFEISPAEEAGYYSPEADEHNRRKIALFDRHADRIYALNPDLLHVLPPRAEFLPYANIDPREWTPTAGAGGSSGRPVVLHAPTHRGVKGTRFIIEAVERLRGRDRLDFEFVLVEGLSHAEARRLYERADLLVDQLLCGWYGGLAVELMALGKPVVCYVRVCDLKFLPPGMRDDLPLISATPSTVYDVLKHWLTAGRGGLPEAGRRSRAYVERWHDPLKVAARVKKDYEEMAARGGRRVRPARASQV